MAESSRYHLLHGDNRPSLDSLAGDDERLLGPAEDEPISPTKGRGFRFSFHPTSYLRSLIFILHTISFAFFIVAHRKSAIPAILFTSFAMVRNLSVLLHHGVARHIHFHVEFVGTSRSNRLPKVPALRHSIKKEWVQVAIDLFIIGLLIIAIPIALKANRGHYYWRRPTLLLEGCVLGWVAMALQVLAVFDTGSPSKFTITGGFRVNSDNKNERTASLPHHHGDVEVAAQPQMIDRGGSPLAATMPVNV